MYMIIPDVTLRLFLHPTRKQIHPKCMYNRKKRKPSGTKSSSAPPPPFSFLLLFYFFYHLKQKIKDIKLRINLQ